MIRTRMAAEPRNLVTQYSRTELRRASFAIRVTEQWDSLPTEQKNAKDSKAFRKMRKQEDQSQPGPRGRYHGPGCDIERLEQTTPRRDVPTTCLPGVLGTSLQVTSK
jgi:hypothetical protein